MTNDCDSALAVARAYHRAWESRDFDQAATYIADDLVTDVPINAYRSKAEWLQAVRETRQVTSGVHVLAEFGTADEALLLYDLRLDPIGNLRVAEHFVVASGRIVQIRHVHDTFALRAAGFGRG
jgi:limonene-1,2-epoxide hydrolase